MVKRVTISPLHLCLDFEQIPSKVAGVVPRGDAIGQFNPGLMPKISDKAVTPMTEFCLAAAEEALSMSGWKPSDEVDKMKTGN